MLSHARDEARLPAPVAAARMLAIGSATTRATLYPSVVPGSATAIVLPALGRAAAGYARLAHVLNLHGLNVVTIDLRGVGTSSIRADADTDWGYLDLVDQETCAAVELARDAYPSSPIFLAGHAEGGHLALLHLARHPASGVAGAFLVGSGSPYFRMHDGVARLALQSAAAMIAISTRRSGVGPGSRLLFSSAQPRSLMNEWLVFARTGRFVVAHNHGWHAESALGGVRCPIVALGLRGDRHAPPRAIRHLCEKTSAALWYEQVQSAGNGAPPGRCAWLDNPESTVAAIAANLCRLGIVRSGLAPVRSGMRPVERAA